MDIGQISDCTTGLDPKSDTYRAYIDSFNSDSMICAGKKSGGKDVCQGDSGGGLICQKCSSCQFYLAGIVSYGQGCGVENRYNVYTKVSYFEDWIKSRVKMTSMMTSSSSENLSNLTGKQKMMDTEHQNERYQIISNKEKSVCSKKVLPTYSLWSSWSSCQVIANNRCQPDGVNKLIIGYKYRFRTCNFEPSYCRTYEGLSEEKKECFLSRDPQYLCNNPCESAYSITFHPKKSAFNFIYPAKPYFDPQTYNKFDGIFKIKFNDADAN